MQSSPAMDLSTLAFISTRSKKLLIDGEWVPAASGREIETFNPSNGKVIANLARGDFEDIDRAVKAARKALEGEWGGWKPYDRQRLFVRILDLLEKNFDEFAYLETP